jgi:hypothetical protein
MDGGRDGDTEGMRPYSYCTIQYSFCSIPVGIMCHFYGLPRRGGRPSRPPPSAVTGVRVTGRPGGVSNHRSARSIGCPAHLVAFGRKRLN